MIGDQSHDSSAAFFEMKQGKTEELHINVYTEITMPNIIKWFDDFPRRALELLAEIEPLATERDRIGTLSLMVAPSLIIAPYERLQTYARRKNPQADFLYLVYWRGAFGGSDFDPDNVDGHVRRA